MTVEHVLLTRVQEATRKAVLVVLTQALQECPNEVCLLVSAMLRFASGGTLALSRQVWPQSPLVFPLVVATASRACNLKALLLGAVR